MRWPARRPCGLVLILVMIVVAMISLAGMSFVALMSTENKAVHLRGEELQVEYLLGSGEENIKALLELTDPQRRDAGGVTSNRERFRGVLVVGDEKSPRQGRYSVFSPIPDGDSATGVRWGLDNESARLNLAALPQWERRRPGSARRALLKLPRMTESVADAILDWIDPDSSPRPVGAEADYYAGLSLPYAPRNAVPACIEELLLVKGVTRTMLFGEEMLAGAGVSKAGPQRSTDASTSDEPPWASLLTLYSGERNLTSQGKSRIDLNQENLNTLYRRLTAVLSEEQARFVVLYRQFGPSNDPTASDSGATDRAVKLDFQQPGRVRLESVLDLVGIRVTATAPGESRPTVVESPFQNEPVAMSGYLPKLLDQTTVESDAVIRGRVNIDLAPREVLAAVPGMDDAVAERILASRRAADTAERRHVAWPLTEGLLDLAAMKALLPYVTTGGDVYRAQIVGFFDASGPAARAEVVIDATRSPVRRVYWKDLSLFGLGASRRLLGGVSTEEEKEAWGEETSIE